LFSLYSYWFGEIDFWRTCNIFGSVWAGSWACLDRFVIFLRDHPIDHLFGGIFHKIYLFLA
jgi:hypothetical protein